MELNSTEVKTIQHSIPKGILDDILTRFLIVVPEAAKQNLIRICFQIELAHWFYLDFYVEKYKHLKACGMYEFSAHVFQHIPSLRCELYRLKDILQEWREYKLSVPTYGAIILSENMTHVLLVQSYWVKTSWGFPKGKVNEDEDPAHCARREVLEETGFDIQPYLNHHDYLEKVINEQSVRLYIIKNVPLNTRFAPLTRGEIKACSWFAVTDLPTYKRDLGSKARSGLHPNAFYMVVPFVKQLKHICINEQRRATRSSQKPEVDDTKSEKKKEKSNTRRQLFPEQENETQFCAPSWLNFKFNRFAIMECVP